MDSFDLRSTRREALVWGAGGLALFGAAPLLGSAPVTESMTIGPFYPVLRPLDQDADLTMVNGVKTRARGDVLQLFGRVLRPDGAPAAGARVEMWQANAAGRYAHPADGSRQPLDDGFQGFGVQVADAEGRYRFKTVRPGAYAIPDGRVRTPHLHFKVEGRSSLLVTQMFFPGEAMNARDFLFKSSENPASLMAARAALDEDVSALAYRWDIVLVSS